MFLSELSSEEKKSFLSLADSLIRADGKILKSEKLFLKKLFFEMGIGRSINLTPMTIREACTTFKTKKSKVAVIMDLIALGYSDTNYSCNEADLVKDIAVHFQISLAEFLELESMALKILKLKDEVRAYMIEEN